MCYMERPDRIDTTFQGQQEDERILYVTTPHAVMQYMGLAKVVILAILFAVAWGRDSSYVEFLSGTLQVLGFILLILLAGFSCWWRLKYFRLLRTYITDRRLVQFEAVFPIAEKKRTMFWRDVVETRGTASSVMWRAMNIGDILVSPFQVDKGDNILIPYAYYFEDLTSYMEKLVHYNREKPDKLYEVKPFITKPRGQRD